MLGLGLGEILVICLVILLVVGPDQLPQFMRTAGKTYAKLRRMSDELRRSFTAEVDRMEADERRKDLETRRKRAEEERQRAKEIADGQVVPQESASSLIALSETEDPEAPAPRAILPPGVTPEEWRRLPAHIQAILRTSPSPSLEDDSDSKRDPG